MPVSLIPKQPLHSSGKPLRDVYLAWITKIVDEGSGLTDWEESFVESITDQLSAGRMLSDKQAEILERIYTDKTP